MSIGATPRSSDRNVRFVVPAALPVEIDRAALLSNLAQTAKVTVLSAPTGYGKSTLLAQYARQLAAPVWIRLNEEARDARSLLSDLAEASRAAGVDVPTWDRLSLSDQSRELLLSALTEDLNHHDADLNFCIDGGEHLSKEAAALLAAFATLLGEGHQLTVAQRDGSEFSAATFLARGEGRLLDAEQLSFTPNDTVGAVEQFGQSVSAAALQATYQGWPWGIMLALRTRQAGASVTPADLAGNVLKSLPDDIASALPALSVLEFWSADGAARMGVELPDGWIDLLQRAGLPMSAVSRGRFVPHDVIRELLTEQLRQQPAAWATMHARAALHAEAQGEPYSAIRHYVEAGQVDQAVHLAEQLVPRWYRAADWRLAEEALRLIPMTALSAELRSIYALAVLELGDLARARALLNEQPAAEATGTTHFALGLVALRTGNLQDLRDHITAGLEVATQQRDIIQLTRLKALYFQSSADPEAAIEAATEAVERAEALGDASLRLAASGVKAYILQRQGQVEAALQEHERAYRVGMQLGLAHRLMGVVQQVSPLYHARGEIAKAAQIQESFLAICERSYPLGVPVLKSALGKTYRYLGRHEEGRRLLWEALDQFRQFGQTVAAAETLNILFFSEMLGPERHRTFGVLHDLQRTLGTDPAAHLGPLLQEMSAGEAYVAGELDEAMALLGAARAAMADRGERFTTIEALRGTILWQQGQASPADAQALRAAAEEDGNGIYVHTLLELAVPLMQHYVSQGWEAEYFQNLLQRLAVTESASPAQVQLRLSTFGSVNVTLANEPIRLGHSSALEALTYWLLHPEARQDDVAEHVWGHSDLKRARQSVQVARSAINAAFREAAQAHSPASGDLLVSAGQGRKNPRWALNPHVEISTDVQAFLNSHAPDLMLRTHPESFLPDSDSEWVQHFRTALTVHAVRVLEQAATQTEPMTALTYLVRAADFTQHREGYEKVVRLAQQTGQTGLLQAAQQALSALERGEVTMLGQRWSEN